ncbi:MAG: hypothetical protein ACTSPE_13335 [Candidatus Thorarchaeota archaeon]
MQTELIAPADAPLIAAETAIVIGLVVATAISLSIRGRHLKLARYGWNYIVGGLVLLVVHALFDVLDTLQIEDLLVEIFNVLDGTTFLIGMICFAVGIVRIAEHGAKEWGLDR